MNDLEVKETIETTVKTMVLELKKQGLLKEGKNPFQKTEQLLYNYMNFKAAIQEKENYIRFIQENGIQKKSKSITSYGGNGSFEIQTDEDKRLNQIETLANSIMITRKYIEIIDEALSKISDDKYYSIIRMRYFEGKSREQMAEHFDVDVATISRNKNRLINILKIHLFSDEVIAEIFG